MSKLSDRLVAAYRFCLLKRLSIRVAGAMVVLGISLFSIITIVENRVASTVAALPLQVGELEYLMGYGGLIDNFKNFILRPDEQQYAEGALESAEKALRLLQRLEVELSALLEKAELTNTREAIAAYRARVSVVAEMNAAGATSREIDAVVRYDDRPALQEVSDLQARVVAAVTSRLELLHWLGVATFVLSVGGGGVVLLLVLNENSKAKAAYHASEDALRREKAGNDELREFSYAVSHDVKAPMNTLHLLLSELGDGMAHKRWSPEQEELVRQSLKTVERAQAQIESVMRFAGVIDGDAGLKEIVVLADLVRSVADDLRAAFEEAEGTLLIGDLPVLRGDSSQVRLLLQNLMENALKYRRPDVPATVHVHAEIGTRTGDVRIHVTDNGIGIDPRQHDRIFGMFKRLHRQDQISGIGLGLSVCQRVVRNIGGEIGVTSEPGRGSTFTVILPKERIVKWPIKRAA